MDVQTRAVERLQDELEGIFDHTIVHPITIGDSRHEAIVAYRASLPGRQLPPDEAKLMRKVIFLSRFKSRNIVEQCDKRNDAQTAAGEWYELLEKKYCAQNGGGVPSHVQELDAYKTLRSSIKRRLLETIARLIHDGTPRPTGQQIAEAMTMTRENARQHLAGLGRKGLLDNEGNGYFFPPQR